MPASRSGTLVASVRLIQASASAAFAYLPTARFAGNQSCCTLRRNALARGAAVLVWLVLGIGVLSPAFAQSGAIGLSQQTIGVPPPQFMFWRAGQADVGHWVVVDDATSTGGTAIQRSDSERKTESALAVYTPASARNARIRTKFKLIDGSAPSAALALRITGPNDYYLVRASADEQRVSILRIVGGVSEEIASVDADIARNHWQTLEVVARDNEFVIWLDQQWILTTFDDSKLVGGQFGIWTERDDVTRFSQFEISPLTSGDWRFDPRGRFGG
jgi:hypothetical protein